MTVSIIVPVYDVRKYIVECLDSIACQTLSTNLECILIDDCGTDDSMALADSYISKYKGDIHFSIIHHERNRGLSAARNTGVNAAKGEYVFFLDSDDALAPDCIEVLTRTLEKRKYDLVVADYIVEGGEDVFQHVRTAKGEYLGRSVIANAKKKHLWYPMAWGKLYRRDFLLKNKLEFCEGILNEDELFSVEVACMAESMYCLPDSKIYVYKVRPGSIMTASRYEMRRDSCKRILCHMYDFIQFHSLKKDRDANDLLYYLFSYANEVSWKYSKSEFLGQYGNYRKIICRRYGERLVLNNGIKAIFRDLHFLFPTSMGKRLFQIQNRFL